MRTTRRGFTLIELMITVAIAAILAAIAYPNYSRYVTRSNRVDATAALLKIRAAQENYYFKNHTYATATQLNTAFSGITTTERGYYTISISATDYTADYTATATATSGGRQYSDTACRSFSVTDAGTRSAQNSSSATSAAIKEECWR